MQSIILAGAIGPGAAEAGIFYFGLPKIAVGMPWAPFFASGFAGYGYGGLTLKFPSAQLGITFWGAGEQVIN
jgi:hypothetical protein